MSVQMKRIAVMFVALAGLSWAVRAERGGLERGNRLHRAGLWEEAEAIYRAEANRTGEAALRYNLGTALAVTRSTDAEVELSRAAASTHREVRSRAAYNGGFVQLDRALHASQVDSIRQHAQAAIDANRNSLRLVPDNLDAKWNLSIALRLLDSIDAIERRSGREVTDGAVEADVVTRSLNVPDAAEDEFVEDPPAEGEEEAIALTGDEAPLSPEQVAEVLGRTHRDATDLLGKLLALQSRSRWGRAIGRAVRRW